MQSYKIFLFCKFFTLFFQPYDSDYPTNHYILRLYAYRPKIVLVQNP